MSEAGGSARFTSVALLTRSPVPRVQSRVGVPPVGGAPGRGELQLVVLKVQRAGTVDEERARWRCGTVREPLAAWDRAGCGGSLEEATSHDSEATLL